MKIVYIGVSHYFFFMRHFSLSSISDSSVPNSFHIVFNKWLKAVTAFQESYYQLSHYVLLNGEQPSRLIGQCSTSQVTDLLAKMGDELKTITAEMDTPLSLSSLINHTARLTPLINQASVILGLLTHSSC